MVNFMPKVLSDCWGFFVLISSCSRRFNAFSGLVPWEMDDEMEVYVQGFIEGFSLGPLSGEQRKRTYGVILY